MSNKVEYMIHQQICHRARLPDVTGTTTGVKQPPSSYVLTHLFRWGLAAGYAYHFVLSRRDLAITRRASTSSVPSKIVKTRASTKWRAASVSSL